LNIKHSGASLGLKSVNPAGHCTRRINQRFRRCNENIIVT